MRERLAGVRLVAVSLPGPEQTLRLPEPNQNNEPSSCHAVTELCC
jgi:hypothetical protein